VIPVKLFPKVHRWGINSRCVAEHASTWNGLVVRNRMENRITTLELLGDDWYLHDDQSRTARQTRDKLLLHFLCTTPTLLHLNTGKAKLTLSALRSENDKRTIWACRGLKTLSMRFEWDRYDGNYPWSARLFGYLGRVCPQLQELTLSIGYQVWPLMKGLCLLTRLRDLRKLELRTFGANSTDREPFQREDFAWIQGCTTKTPVTDSHLSIMNLWPSFRLSRPRNAVDTNVTATKSINTIPTANNSATETFACEFAYEDYKYCLDKMRTRIYLHHNTGSVLYSPISLESDRARMRQQQKINQYLTDHHNRPIPMVDGLQDFEFSGTFLDIEACLEAQIFRILKSQRRLQQQQLNKTHEAVAAGLGSEPGSGPCSPAAIAKSSQPWPYLEELKFVHEYHAFEPHDKIHHKNMQRGFEFLRQARPDIKFTYRSEVKIQ
jgi:hypothetical protein